ncbi:MAG: molybdopterin biosynthesis protein [Chloroflexota bacterium]|nr:molybdopterin biosynthesis protein [Chloroflexota bacterium]
MSNIPIDQSVQKFHSRLRETGALARTTSEVIPLENSMGRVTFEPMYAVNSSPHYDSAAMDGIAVKSHQTSGASEQSPLKLSIQTEAVWVDTGDPVPTDFNAVVMVENVHEIDSKTVEIRNPVPPYQHIRAIGEDIAATELILPANQVLRPVDLGACAAAGIKELSVRKKPSVGIVPTGSELVPVGSALRPGDIVEFNSLMLSGLISQWGGTPKVHPSTPDDYSKLRSVLEQTVDQHDIVIFNAGSSAGSEDYTAQLIEELGELIVHGIAYKPGHPVVLGIVQQKPVLGIPGYPVSAVLTSEIFVKPLIGLKLGISHPERQTVQAVMSRKVVSTVGEDEHIRVMLGRVGEKMIATPIQRGAGVITSLSRADGLAMIPRNSEGIDADTPVNIELLRDPNAIDNKIMVTGSHDLTIDLISSELGSNRPPITLSSSNVGSIGGLIALQRGEAHIAGVHLLDDKTGTYNLPFIHKSLPDTPIALVRLVERIQGLMVLKGNPKNISGLSDLSQSNISYINRQRGSGTRLLLDYQIKILGMSPDDIQGYDREEYTHLGVAAAVSAGKVDTGLGILSAANAMGLQFIPVLSEQYDLVVPIKYHKSSLIKPLYELIQSSEFQAKVHALGGYDTDGMGKVTTLTGS